MKISIDGFHLMMPMTGIGYYVYYMLVELMRLAPQNKYYLCDWIGKSSLYMQIDINDHFERIDKLSSLSRIPVPFFSLARILTLINSNLHEKKSPPLKDMDIFWGTAYRAIYKESFKTVITIHDMAHMYYPQFVPSSSLTFLKSVLPKEAKKTQTILAISENTKKDVIKFLKVKEEKVKVIYPGLSNHFYVEKDEKII
ncbi:group 1 glycosyl transferase, partial [Candidatus Magnetoovum chiemensis]